MYFLQADEVNMGSFGEAFITGVEGNVRKSSKIHQIVLYTPKFFDFRCKHIYGHYIRLKISGNTFSFKYRRLIM